jgi:hypothetical protein
VPIRLYPGTDRSFGTEELTAMGDAFSATLDKLGLKDRNDPMVEIVAQRIIRAAMAGERNPAKLTEIGTDGRES